MLMEPGKIPGSSGTRNLKDNISDLRAQVAANQKLYFVFGFFSNSSNLYVLMALYSQNNAEIAVRNMLKEIGNKVSFSDNYVNLCAEDYMDDGTMIKLQIQIDKNQGTAIFDFNDTGYEVYGNCNAPKAVTLSAIIYCLRCMVGYDVPLNQGCLAPVKVIIPKGSILSPSQDAAIVGGNVLTSQRIVDVVFKAFKSCAASQ
ncbi:5-oxoprolinase-like, partial [Centruroides sculpturatus]|uniref:5-oxoprolinase-like n=1 Tax=Centruroides sculpturatus TaxID=218467 RepID=UPI000C6E9814